LFDGFGLQKTPPRQQQEPIEPQVPIAQTPSPEKTAQNLVSESQTNSQPNLLFSNSIQIPSLGLRPLLTKSTIVDSFLANLPSTLPSEQSDRLWTYTFQTVGLLDQNFNLLQTGDTVAAILQVMGVSPTEKDSSMINPDQLSNLKN